MLASVPGHIEILKASREETLALEGEQKAQKEQQEGPEQKHPP